VVKVVRVTGRRTENEGADDNALRVLRDIPDRRNDANAVTYGISEARKKQRITPTPSPRPRSTEVQIWPGVHEAPRRGLARGSRRVHRAMSARRHAGGLLGEAGEPPAKGRFT
jgi:hypothetical protein